MPRRGHDLGAVGGRRRLGGEGRGGGLDQGARRLGRLGGADRRAGRWSLRGGLEQQHGPRDRGVQRADAAAHGDAHGEVDAPADGRPRCPAPRSPRRAPGARAGRPRGRPARRSSSAPTSRRPRVRRSTRPPARSSRGTSSRCSTAPADALIAGGREGCGAARREDHAVDAAGLRAAQHRAHVLGILERVEHQQERRLAPFPGRASTSSMRGPAAGSTTSATPWCPSKPASDGERAPLDLHDRDAQRGGMQHQLLQGVAAIGDDQQAAGGPTRGERLLHWPSTGDELLSFLEPGQVRTRRPAAGIGGGPRGGPTGGCREGRSAVGSPRPTLRAPGPGPRRRAVGTRSGSAIVGPRARAAGHRTAGGRPSRRGWAFAVGGRQGRGEGPARGAHRDARRQGPARGRSSGPAAPGAPRPAGGRPASGRGHRSTPGRRGRAADRRSDSRGRGRTVTVGPARPADRPTGRHAAAHGSPAPIGRPPCPGRPAAGSRSRGRAGRSTPPVVAGSRPALVVTPGHRSLPADAPSLAVPRVLDRDAEGRQLLAQRVGAAQSRAARAAARASRSACAPGWQRRLVLVEDGEHLVQIEQQRGRGRGVGGGQRPLRDAPVELPDEVEDRGQGGRDVQVVIERRGERCPGAREQDPSVGSSARSSR